jgi:NAD(P)-dependent dehydrogenase (short-subunit alcohol dehydrogenase family)
MAETKVAWVTGCTRGLGRALVNGLAARGWTVAGCARSEAGIAAMREAWTAPHFFAVADVVDDVAVAEWRAAAVAATGAPDLLLNNAGLINKPAPLWEVSAAEFSQVVDVNLKGVANVLRHAIPAMLARGRGVIANFSSGWGRSTAPEVAPYCATKWAIEGLTQALAQELPRGLAAVALNPGIIDTEMLRSAWGEGAASYPDPAEWARRAVPFVERLSEKDNGRAVTV